MRFRFLATAIAAVIALTGCESLEGIGGGSSADDIAARLQADLRDTAGDRVFFPTNVHVLDTRAKEILDRQASWLSNNDGVSVVIEGHADHRGSEALNKALGDRRARSVRSYLISNGVPSTRVKAVSFGEARPAAVPTSPAALAQNRRALTAISVVTVSVDAPESVGGVETAPAPTAAPTSENSAEEEEGGVFDRIQSWF